jgi:hypothetical protein
MISLLANCSDHEQNKMYVMFIDKRNASECFDPAMQIARASPPNSARSGAHFMADPHANSKPNWQPHAYVQPIA